MNARDQVEAIRRVDKYEEGGYVKVYFDIGVAAEAFPLDSAEQRPEQNYDSKGCISILEKRLPDDVGARLTFSELDIPRAGSSGECCTGVMHRQAMRVV